MIDAKVMSNFVQNSVPHLLANAVGVTMAIGFNRALINGDDLRVRNSRLTIGGQRHPFIESEERISCFDAHSLHHLFARLVLHPHQNVFHLLLKLSRNRTERLLDEEFERTQRTFIGNFAFDKSVICISFYHAIVAFAARVVSPWAHCAIQYTLWREEERSHGSKGESAEQEEPTGKKVIQVVEIGTEEEECDEETHQGEKVTRAITVSIFGRLIQFWFAMIVVLFLLLSHIHPLFPPKMCKVKVTREETDDIGIFQFWENCPL